MKQFYIMYNVGTAKYVINSHDGVKKHKDGSSFFDVDTFKNKKLFEKEIKNLLSQGYQKI